MDNHTVHEKPDDGLSLKPQREAAGSWTVAIFSGKNQKGHRLDNNPDSSTSSGQPPSWRLRMLLL